MCKTGMINGRVIAKTTPRIKDDFLGGFHLSIELELCEASLVTIFIFEIFVYHMECSSNIKREYIHNKLIPSCFRANLPCFNGILH